MVKSKGFKTRLARDLFTTTGTQVFFPGTDKPFQNLALKIRPIIVSGFNSLKLIMQRQSFLIPILHFIKKKNPSSKQTVALKIHFVPLLFHLLSS